MSKDNVPRIIPTLPSFLAQTPIHTAITSSFLLLSDHHLRNGGKKHSGRIECCRKKRDRSVQSLCAYKPKPYAQHRLLSLETVHYHVSHSIIKEE